MTQAGRKPLPDMAVVDTEINLETLGEASRAADQVATLQADYGEGRDLANQLLGQVQMADTFAKFSLTVSASKLAFVRENKLYRSLKGKKTADGQRFLTGTWDEYCGLLGRSRQQVEDDIANLKIFGEQALESMSTMGIGYRELRQYRKLPEDQKLALIEVARAGDKEGFVELAEEIIAKHAKEKEVHARVVEEAADKLEAKDRVLEQAHKRINKLEDQAARTFRPRAGSEAKTVQEQTLLDEINEATLAARHATRRLFLVADTALDGSAREAIELAARQAVEYLSQQLIDIATEFGIAVDFEQRLRPAWLDESALDAMVARQRGDADSQPPAAAPAAVLGVVR